MMNGLMDESMNRKAATSKLVAKAWDLRVYKEAFVFALAIHETSLTFPKIEQYDLASQLRRASKSICANIAEGFAKQKYSKPEFSRYLSYAEASANEVQVWLQFAVKLKYITKQQYTEWVDQADKIAAQVQRLRP
jgi:four helix bundle protein